MRTQKGTYGCIKPQRGFTLIEMLVSTAIFAIVMVIALGALLAMSESDRKAQSLKAVINNLNFSLDSMSRSVRTGTGYNCGSQNGGDCATVPGTYFAFTDSDGDSVAFCYNGTQLMREVVPFGGTLDSSCSASGFIAVTAPEVKITNLSFYLLGSSRTDAFQPKLTILISGYVQVTGTQKTTFNLETSITERLYDQ